MNPPRASAEDSLQFPIATPNVASATEAARAQPDRPDAPAHDAFPRLLHRPGPDPATLWDEARPSVEPGGALGLDDSVLDKPFARHMGLVGRCWSGRHRRAVAGIGPVTLLWTDGAALVPCDDRPADPVGGEAKNDHVRAMLAVAKGRGLSPRRVVFGTWYSGKDDLKAVRAHGGHFPARVRCNRRVNPDRTGNRAIDGCDLAATGAVARPEGFGPITAFRIAAGDGGTEHGIPDDLAGAASGREVSAGQAWGLEEYHRGLKRHGHGDRCQVRRGRAQAGHIGSAIRAFLRPEWHRRTSGVRWFAAKTAIVREAVRDDLAAPRYCLPEKATA